MQLSFKNAPRICVVYSHALYFLALHLAGHPTSTSRALGPLEPPCGFCLFSLQLSCTFNFVPFAKRLTQGRPIFLVLPPDLTPQLSRAGESHSPGQTGVREIPDGRLTTGPQPRQPTFDLCPLSHMKTSDLFHCFKLLPSRLMPPAGGSHFPLLKSTESPQLPIALLPPSLPLVLRAMPLPSSASPPHPCFGLCSSALSILPLHGPVVLL